MEACPLDLAPTSSTTCALALGDALAVTLLTKRGFTKSDFHALHPGGKLGQTLLSVSEIMKTNKSLPVIKSGNIVGNAILEMSSKGFGCVGIISTDNKTLLGIITDGDLRRNMTKGLLEKKVEQIMTVNPLTLKPETLVSEALNLMNEKSITNIFVTQKNKPVGIIHMHEILRLST
jgi:arabinose-5-phosphate isomerase